MKITKKEKELLKWIEKGLVSYQSVYSKDRSSFDFIMNKKTDEARKLLQKLYNEPK